MANTHMKLGLFLTQPGHHVAAWRHPEVNKDSVINFNFIKHQLLLAEQAKFDLVFLGDGIVTGYDKSNFGKQAVARFEPLTLLSSLAAVTEHIGLIGTASTTYNEPYSVARMFASLDHLSGGRAGWNIVTSGGKEIADAYNGVEPLHHERYKRANEFVDVVTKLWDSWEDDAIVFNQETGQYLDTNKVHPIQHKGEHFSVKGPLNITRPVQGHPVLVQAGSSEDGQELAARYGEIVFTAWQTLEEAQAFYKSLKGRMAKYNRDASELKIMPGLYPVVGRTEEEAKAKHQQLLDLIPDEVGVAYLSAHFGVDLTGYPADGPLPELPEISEINGIKSRFQLLKDLADRENLTIRQLYQRIAGARGHKEIVGTPEQIADLMQEWVEKQGADGFNIMPPILPSGISDFAELVIPELQKRGLFRTEYEGNTLRDRVSLKRPVSRYTGSLV
ncbi:LLM class flavin-dependent oxidoreductase [Paenibacillus xylaniclasticus]|uniref:LLM class flavin-dependent oxidoreductase n=1 Tax=Paenibacillus xylaniclasticus TaxID=588083 RepID=UPI000FDA8DC3|nr:MULTISPECIES: LLM class flavin-dependent oxidoreductase [Paenibacillus]GFN32936.1 monooxygenase [Paenibacillus curdlanolyticus]